MRVFVALLYVLALLGALAGAVELLTAMSPSASAAQVAAITARALAFAVIPYVLARAVEGIVRPWPSSSDPASSQPGTPAHPPGPDPAPTASAEPPARVTASFGRRHR